MEVLSEDWKYIYVILRIIIINKYQYNLRGHLE